MLRTYAIAAVAFAAPACATADVALLTQQRFIEATTSFDGNLVTAAAPDFAPFIATVTADTTFPAANGGSGANTAVSSINCLVDPNAIRASGSLSAAGGLTINGGPPTTGEAAAEIIVTFVVTTATPFRLVATPRPSTLARDEYNLDLGGITPHFTVFSQDETMPAASVDLTGTLSPGEYEIRYTVELTGDAALTATNYGFTLSLGTQPCGPSDIGSTGGLAAADGVLDNNDFIVYIDRFFAQSPSADLGTTGGVAGSDGGFDNND
ncbi:MAG: GC-type dockerin domain-anchored protein, partial [Phycisphaerales bacterium]|nr:GC-type dockerin domain-anchored protein [Phycisphaerales bacterium]